MTRIQANTIATYVEGGIEVQVMKPSKITKTITFNTKHRGRTRTASEFAFMHRVARK